MATIRNAAAGLQASVNRPRLARVDASAGKPAAALAQASRKSATTMPEETSTPSAPTHSDVKIVFTPSGRQGRVPHGTSVLAAARQLGVDIDSVCGGRAMCGRCQVNVGTGEFAKHGISSGDDSLDAVTCLLYTSPSPRDATLSRMPSSA